MKTVEISLDDIDLIEYKKKLFGASYSPQTRNRFEDFPGSELLTRTLKVKRKNREIAANIASNVNLFLSEKKLRELDGDTE